MVKCYYVIKIFMLKERGITMKEKEREVSMEEVREMIGKIKENQVLSIDFRGEDHKNEDIEGYFVDDPTEGDEGYEDKMIY